MNGRLQSDFSNLVTGHLFRSYQWYQPRLQDGFDFVKDQACVLFPTGVRWFRRWNSGLLEHGGTVDTSAEDAYCRT